VIWKSVSNYNYLSSAFSNENGITVIWARQLFGDTKSRECIIQSKVEWNALSLSDSFVPRYKDGKPPQDPDAEIFTLYNYYPNATSDELKKGIQAVNNNSQILQMTTAFHIVSKSRLIVDGLKRSLGILSKMNAGQEFRPVTILECYGSTIPQIFFGDFEHIVHRNKD
jgi:hypothetical protein